MKAPIRNTEPRPDNDGGPQRPSVQLDGKLRLRLERALNVVDDQGTMGPRLLENARRLWARLTHFQSAGLVPGGLDQESLELCAYAIQLPLRQVRSSPRGRTGRSNLRDRAEEAAEMLLAMASADADEGLLDRGTRVLYEMPHRAPMLDEARVLADAVNLDDFGLTGLVWLCMQAGHDGEGIAQLSGGLEKREQYGYWDARLRDGFHFEAVRQIARRRLETSRQVARMLKAELGDAEG
jgi:hypothetical protein